MREGESEGALDWDRRGFCDVSRGEGGIEGRVKLGRVGRVQREEGR